MKKLLSAILVLVLVLSCVLPVFAADDDTFTLTVTNDKDKTNLSINGVEVTAYKLFDLTMSEDGESVAYFLGEDSPFAAEAKQELLATYFDLVKTLDGSYNAIPMDMVDSDNSTNMLNIAADFVANGLLDGVNATATATGASEKAALENLEPGYYLVVASGDADGETVESVLMMQSVSEDTEIAIKASAPKLTKEITQDEDGTNADSFTIGDSVPFTLEVTIPSMLGYSSYALTITDTLSTGLTAPSEDDIEVLVDGDELPEGVSADITVNGQVITIEIANAIKLAGKEKVTVTYEAVLNSNALITDEETNTATLDYSNNPYDDSDSATTPPVVDHVYNFDLVIDKFAANPDDEEDTGSKLAGAKFVLVKKPTANSEAFYSINPKSGIVSWLDDVDDDAVTIQETDEDGAASFQGLEAGTYFLREVEAPLGYNMLQEDVEVVIQVAYDTDGSVKTGEGAATSVELVSGRYQQIQQISNKAGSVLPSTGGMGTTLFYVAGAVLVLLSGVMLIAKRRVNME